MAGKIRIWVDHVRFGFSDNPARLINLARILLALTSCALIALASPAAPPQPSNSIFALLAAYSIFALGTAIISMRSWWIGAKLVPINTVVDWGMFLAMLLLTDGRASLFFPFFLLLLISSPHRIGWVRAFAVGLGLGLLMLLINELSIFTGGVDAIDLERLVPRLIALAMLALLIALFYREPRAEAQTDGWRELLLQEVMRENELPVPLILAQVQSLFGADRLVYVWSERASARVRMVLFERDEPCERSCAAEEFSLLRQVGTDHERSFLFDGVRGRVLSSPVDGRKVPFQLKPFANLIDPPLTEGICIPIACQVAVGRLFVVRNGRVSDGDLGRAEMARSAINASLDRYQLVDAIRDSAFSKARLAMARNIHDSVLQNLAGLGMRFGAMKLDLIAGRVTETIGELDKLQALVKEEQLGLRALIRNDPWTVEERCNVIPILRELATTLAEQWKIQCAVSAFPDPIMIPARLGSEVRFLVREAVANAARHAQASWVRVSIANDDDAIKLLITSDRNMEPATGEAKPTPEPRSLSERVEGLGGSIMLKQKATGTHLTAFLPRRGT